MTVIMLLGCICVLVGVMTMSAELYRLRTASAGRPPDPPARNGRDRNNRLSAERNPRCGICLGTLGDAPAGRCACGAVFHRECADSLEECPLCGRRTAALTAAAVAPRSCPACGKPLTGGGLCRCGALVPDGRGRFPCPVCGGTADGRNRVCRTCGTVFARGRSR